MSVNLRTGFATNESALASFIETRRSPSTQRGYERALKAVLADPDKFLELARLDKRKAEEMLIAYVIARKNQVRPTSLVVWLSVAKSFLDYYEVPLNWKRIRATAPRARMVSMDRAPTTEELRKAVEAGGLREKVIISLLSSSGMRLGGLSGLTVADVEKLHSGIGRITVYRGAAEEYVTFCTPEAMNYLDQYLQARVDIGERVPKDAPLLRDAWSYEAPSGRRTVVAPEIAHPLLAPAIQGQLRRLWKKTGARDAQGRKFKVVHGTRAWFRSQATRAMGPDFSELLMGHAASYFKPNLEEMEEAYLKAVELLTLGEAAKLRREKEQDMGKMAVRMEKMEDTMKELLEQLQRKQELEESLRKPKA
jgi:integrase